MEFKERIVHLDLKGAPLKLPYLERVITAAQTNRASGILIEWEDTFPYTGELSEIGSNGVSNMEGLYSLDQVKQIIRSYSNHNFKVIQLVQTIGHMEFVLKHPVFKELREHPHSPAVLCPSKEMSQFLVRMMVDQILEVQPDAEYIHIGADEVWHTAICPDCQHRTSEGGFTSSDLFLAHIRDLATYIKQKRPNITVLIWDDMLRNISPDVLKGYNLQALVQPVIWNYNVQEHFSIDVNLWRNYQQVFPTVWAGSAFKGANGSTQMVSPVARYVSNQRAWLAELTKLQQDLRFSGIILTGWSRYDHYATLCELMPASMSCLAGCLKTLSNYAHLDDCKSSISEAGTSSDEWPFQELSHSIRKLAVLSDECKAFTRSDAIATWLNPWQIERGYTNPLHIDCIRKTAHSFLVRLQALNPVLPAQLKAVLGPRSTDEWIGTFYSPLLHELEKVHQTADMRNNMDASIMPTMNM